MKTRGHTKIFLIEPHVLHYPEQFIIGFCGSASEVLDLADYYEYPDVYKTIPRTKMSQGIVLTKSSKLYYFDTPGKWIAMKQPYAAAGSGMPFALGAMASGASPKEAVLVASKIDPYTGMGVKVLKFE